MSKENVELAHRSVDAFNRRDLDALLALMDEDVEGVPPLASMEGNYHGHAGIRRWWVSPFQGLPDFTIEVVEVRDPGDLTVAVLRARLSLKAVANARTQARVRARREVNGEHSTAQRATGRRAAERAGVM